MTTTIRSAARLIVAGASMSLAASLGPGALPAEAAATDIGNPCVADLALTDVTVVMTARSGDNPLPISPDAAGVVTQAVFNMPARGGSTDPITLKTMRATGVANEYTVVAQSVPLPLAGGAHHFGVRIPIAAGDMLGISGPVQTPVCGSSDTADVVGASAGEKQPGETAPFPPYAGLSIPVFATVEPDVDGDGYGDDSQDECPRSAATQTACPVITLSSTASAKRRSIVVRVSADNPALVTLTGTTKVNGRRVKLTGGTRTVQPGTPGRFTFRYPRALRAALAALPPGRSIKVRLTATTTDVIGEVSTDTSSVRIPSSRGGAS